MIRFNDVSEFAKYSVYELVDKHEPYHEVYRAVNKNLGIQVLVVVVYQIKSVLAQKLLNFQSDLILPPLEQYRTENSLYIVYQMPANVYPLSEYLQAGYPSEEIVWGWLEQLSNFLVETKNKELLFGSLNFKYFTVIKETSMLLYYGNFYLFNEYTYMQQSVKKELYCNDVRVLGYFVHACCSQTYLTELQPKEKLITNALLLQKSDAPEAGVQITPMSPNPRATLAGYSLTLGTLLDDCCAAEGLRISADELLDHPVISPISREQSILSYRHFQFNDFEIVRNIGTGAYGRVDLALHIKSGQYCALKQSSNLATQRFEEDVLRKLSHPNVVRFYGSFEERNISYICMQYCNQGDLYRYITSAGKPDNATALKWITQLSSAMYYMHYKELIHRDIKPQNVLISNGDAFIADFGVSKQLDVETQTVVGTPLYFSPEVFDNKPYGKPSDVFSLGLVFFNILVGSHLFLSSKSDITRFFRNLEKSGSVSDMLDYIDFVELRPLILNMLLFDYKHRFTMEQICQFGLINEYIRLMGLPAPGCYSVLSLYRVIRSDFDLSALFVQTQDVYDSLIRNFYRNYPVLKQAFAPLLYFLPNYIRIYFNFGNSQYINYFSRKIALKIYQILISTQYVNKIHYSSVFADSDDLYIEVSPSFQYQKRGKYQIVFTVALILNYSVSITDDVFICCYKLVFYADNVALKMGSKSVLAVQEVVNAGAFEGQFTVYSKLKIGELAIKPFEQVFYYSRQIDLIGQFANLCFPWLFHGPRGYFKEKCEDWTL